MDGPAPQDWRNYVNITPDSIPLRERSQLAQALEMILHARDGEGLMLLQQARAAMGKPVPIAQNEAALVARASILEGIQLDFQEMAHARVRDEEGVLKVPSITATLVHELFHLTDPRAVEPLAYGLAQLPAESPHHALLSRLQHTELQDAIGTLQAQQQGWYEVFSLLTLTGEDRRRAVIDTKALGAHAFAEMLEATTPVAWQQTLMAAKLIDAQGVYIVEAEATAYADAFMRKNVGAKEALRSHYGNMQVVVEPAVLINPLPVAGNHSYAPFHSLVAHLPAIEPETAVSVQRLATVLQQAQVQCQGEAENIMLTQYCGTATPARHRE